jgi:mRNA interferase RelE/StbE
VAEIVFTADAIDDLRRIGPAAAPMVLKKILLLEQNAEAGYPLGDELTGYRKLVVGRNTWRVVYRITDDKTVEVAEIWAIGARADGEIYAEASARAREAGQTRPEFAGLAAVVDRLGRLAGHIEVAVPVPAEPVPDWLADRLVHTVGMPREKVAALTLRDAVDAWTAFVSTPRNEA